MGGGTISDSCKRFLFSEESRLHLGPTQLSIRCITEGICMGVKQLGHEGQHPTSSSSKVKHERYITLVNSYSACREKNCNIRMMNQEELCNIIQCCMCTRTFI